MNTIRFLSFFMFFTFILFAPNSESAIVLKTKNKQALIHLQGLKTKKGAYFSVVDSYGQKQGIVKIKRVAHTKAIGSLEYGTMAKNWSLEPMSKKRVMAVQQKAKRKAMRQARIQREKIKRKLAAQKRLMKKKKLAQKKRAIRRKLAFYDGEEYKIDDVPEDTNSQSDEILSYGSYNVEDLGLSEESVSESHGGKINIMGEDHGPKSIRRFIVGLSPRLEYNLMRVSPPRNQPAYLMQGIGYGLFFVSDFSLNNFIRTEGSLGAKRFAISAEEEKCGKQGGCFLSVYYLSAGLNLKLNLMEFAQHKLWLAGGGNFMLPLAYSNNILSKRSFSPVHGTLGGGFGLDFTFGNWVVPVSVRGDFYMPTTKTTMTGIGGFHLGVAYKF